MINKEKGDSLDEKWCGNCDDETEHEYYGFIPTHMLDLDEGIYFIPSQICLQCGSLSILNITEQLIKNIENQYISDLEDKGLINENERKQWEMMIKSGETTNGT